MIEEHDKSKGPHAASHRDDPPAAKNAPPLTSAAQDLIGRKLRETYSNKLNEPVPEKFNKLLEQLAKKG